MNVRLLACTSAAFVAGSVVLGLAVFAGDPPAGGGAPPAAAEQPPMPKKIDQPLLKSAVGTWAVTWSMNGPDGAQSGKATSKISMAIGDTALLEDYSSDMMGGFHGLGVVRPSLDGKTLSNWWFDTTMHDPVTLAGPLGDAQAVMEGTIPGFGTMKITWKKVEGGFDFDGTLDGKPWLTQKYRAAK